MSVLEFDFIGTLILGATLLAVRIATEIFCALRGATPPLIRNIRRAAKRWHEAGKTSWGAGRLQLDENRTEVQRYALFALGSFLSVLGCVATLINFPILAQVLSLWLPGDGIGAAPPWDEISLLAAAMAGLVLLAEIATGIKLGIAMRAGEPTLWIRSFLALLIGLETVGATVRAYYATPGTAANWSDPASYGVLVAALLGFVPPVTTVLAAEYGWALFGEPACASFYHRIQSLALLSVSAWLTLAFGSEDSGYLTDQVYALRAETQALRRTASRTEERCAAARRDATQVAAEAAQLRDSMSPGRRDQVSASLMERATRLEEISRGLEQFAGDLLRRSGHGDGRAAHYLLEMGKSTQVTLAIEATSAPQNVRRIRNEQAYATFAAWEKHALEEIASLLQQARALRSGDPRATVQVTGRGKRQLDQARHACNDGGLEAALQVLQERSFHLLESLAGHKQKAHLSQALSTTELNAAEHDRNEQEVRKLASTVSGELALAVRQAEEVREAAVSAIAAAAAALDGLSCSQQAAASPEEAVWGELSAVLHTTRLRIRLARQSLSRALRLRSRKGVRWSISSAGDPQTTAPAESSPLASRPMPPTAAGHRIRPMGRRSPLYTFPTNGDTSRDSLETNQ